MLVYSAVIGTGVGIKHIEAIHNYKNFRVKIICEKNIKKFLYLKKKYKKIKIVSNENEIYKDKDIRLVSIASYDEDITIK